MEAGVRNDFLGSKLLQQGRSHALSWDGRLGIKSFGRKITSFLLSMSEMPLKHAGDARQADASVSLAVRGVGLAEDMNLGAISR